MRGHQIQAKFDDEARVVVLFFSFLVRHDDMADYILYKKTCLKAPKIVHNK
jgi:hypothetical protein